MGNAITRKYDIDETHCANAGLSGCWKIYKGKTKDEIPKEISVWICSKDEVGKRTPAPDRSTLDQLFQDEQERKLMIQMADMQKKVVYEEADRLEQMSDWKARVLGISKNDAI